MRFDILTLFPDAVAPYLETSIMGRARKGEHITTHIWNIRNHATDKHKTTDDTPYGGGAGMVMKIQPIHETLKALEQELPREKQHIIVLSARGEQFTQKKAAELAASGKSITLICGRYEGIDQRVADHLADEELSVGPYVLAGGELGALIIIEAIARLVPGVLGNPESLSEESYSAKHVTEYPQYTKPEVYEDWTVPPVLLSGNHSDITKWRTSQAK